MFRRRRTIGFRLPLFFVSSVALCACAEDDEPDELVVVIESRDATSEAADDTTQEASSISGDVSMQPDGAPTTTTDAPPDRVGADTVSDASGPGDTPFDGRPPKLALCARLGPPGDEESRRLASDNVWNQYYRVVRSDCNVANMLANASMLSTFANAVIAWNLTLWGCRDNLTNELGLVRNPGADLTSADVARLIDDYMSAATTTLNLTATEQGELRRTLDYLAPSAIKRTSSEYTMSTCSDGGDGGDSAASGPSDASLEGGDST